VDFNTHSIRDLLIQRPLDQNSEELLMLNAHNIEELKNFVSGKNEDEIWAARAQ